MEKLDSEILEYINNVEKEIHYTFEDGYKNYLLNHPSSKPEKKILRLANGNEKLVRHFYSMDPNSKIYILKFQSFDSELRDRLVPFAELEFGDTLCFERKTNKIVVYNHETDTIEDIANNWNDFIEKLENDNMLKCPKCNERLTFLMPSGTTLYCNKCEKYYVNDNGKVGEETSTPYTRNDVLY